MRVQRVLTESGGALLLRAATLGATDRVVSSFVALNTMHLLLPGTLMKGSSHVDARPKAWMDRHQLDNLPVLPLQRVVHTAGRGFDQRGHTGTRHHQTLADLLD